jgi:hypothetical protein
MSKSSKPQSPYTLEFVWAKDPLHKFTIGCTESGLILGDRFASATKRNFDFLSLSADPNWIYMGRKKNV